MIRLCWGWIEERIAQRLRGRKEKTKTGGDRGKQERCEDLGKGGTRSMDRMESRRT